MDNGRERPGVADSANGREANGTGDPTIDCDPVPGLAKAIQRIGVAADHGGFELAQHLIVQLRALGHDVFDFGDRQQSPDDDYPDFVIPLAYGVARRHGARHRDLWEWGGSVRGGKQSARSPRLPDS